MLPSARLLNEGQLSIPGPCNRTVATVDLVAVPEARECQPRAPFPTRLQAPISLVMNSGRVNSKGSLEAAGRVLRSFGGSWEAVERAATRDETGVYVVRRSSANGQYTPKAQRSAV